MKDYIKIADKYAKDITTGKILACDYTKRACQRFLDDIEKSNKKDFPFELNEGTGKHTGDSSGEQREEFGPANFMCSRIEMLPHVKGKPWAGTPIKLEPWQVHIIVNVFGWLHKETGLRRFRTCLLYTSPSPRDRS